MREIRILLSRVWAPWSELEKTLKPIHNKNYHKIFKIFCPVIGRITFLFRLNSMETFRDMGNFIEYDFESTCT